VPVEKQLLPNDALKPLYDKVVWVYNYNDFKGGEADRRATRTRMRLSVSSYPQLLLVEPGTLRVVGQTGRTVDSFIKAVQSVRVAKPKAPAKVQAALVAADQLAEQLQTKPSPALAVKGLANNDIAVRVLALEVLADKAPAEVGKRALQLLDVENDLLRYEVCKALAASKQPVPPPVVRKLEALVRDPKGSRNPNVLRINAVKALAGCGTAQSVAAIAEHAASGNYRNGLTGVSIDALAAIGARDPKARAAAIAALAGGFPEPPEPGDRMLRACTALAKRVHGALVKLTGSNVPFPKTYDAAARRQLARAFGAK
jgi:hypothetical protein